MAENSLFWDTSTTGDGATTYSQTRLNQLFQDLFTPRPGMTAPHVSQGILAGLGGELAVTGTASPVSVAAGAAIVAGFFYRNDAAVGVTIPTPGAATRIDRIVLRASYGTTRTVRITRIAGTEGGGAPALTQSAGVTWDIPLAQVSITTGGTITQTDQRDFAHYAMRVGTSQIDTAAVTTVKIADDAVTTSKIVNQAVDAFKLANDAVNSAKIQDGAVTTGKIAANAVTTAKIAADAVTGAEIAAGAVGSSELATNAVSTIKIQDDAITGGKIAANAVTSGKIADNGITTAKIVDLSVTAAKLAVGAVVNSRLADLSVTTAKLADSSVDAIKIVASAVTTGKIADGAVTTAKIADGAVTPIKIGGLILTLLGRQGGSGTSWAIGGTSNFTPATVRVQVGSTASTFISAGGTGTFNITFPVAFSASPIFIAVPSVGGGSELCCSSSANSASSGSIYIRNISSGTGYTTGAYWIAIGAE